MTRRLRIEAQGLEGVRSYEVGFPVGSKYGSPVESIEHGWIGTEGTEQEVYNITFKGSDVQTIVLANLISYIVGD